MMEQMVMNTGGCLDEPFDLKLAAAFDNIRREYKGSQQITFVCVFLSVVSLFHWCFLQQSCDKVRNRCTFLVSRQNLSNNRGMTRDKMTHPTQKHKRTQKEQC